MMTLALVACVKTKQSTPARAEQLYTSPWFRKARRYALQHSDPWRILSAEHGLLDPATEIDPYKTTLYDSAAEERRAWSDAVMASLYPLLQTHEEVLMLAGTCYREYLVGPIEDQDVRVHIPMAGLGLGEQLRFLNDALSP